MSAVDERGALDRPVSLFEHAARLHQLYPDAPLPSGGRPYPDLRFQTAVRRDRLPARERVASVRSALEAFLRDPAASVQTLHDDLTRLYVFEGTAESIVEKLAATDPGRLRATGVWLVGNATDRLPAMVGLAMLVTAGRPDDVPVITTIGLLDYFGPTAVRALAALADGTPHLIWMAEHSGGQTRTAVISALADRADPRAVAWLRGHVVVDEQMRASLARRVAEAISLADLLEADTVEDEVLDQAADLLLAMVTPNDYRDQLVRYRDAGRAYDALARHLPAAPASMRRYAMLVSLIAELRSGHAAHLDWRPGQRERILARLRTTAGRGDWREDVDAALRSADRLTRRRAAWARDAVAGDAGRPTAGPAPRLGIEVAVADPFRPEEPEVRILVDGRPVLAAAFDKGPPHTPETLLERGQLRAAERPHEVRLAVASCTEGCCGALYVTIARDGDTVVWRDWRGHTSAAPPPELRFPVHQYQTELARAEADRSWEWPARTVARLLRTRLTAQPDLLTRWQCRLEWIWAGAREPFQVRFTFSYPEQPEPSNTEPWLQFEQILPIDATPVAHQADRIVQQLETADPKTRATVVGGSREHAERLGYTWPARRR